MKLADATILVVDDEPELLEIFSLWLERHGCKVLRAENGAEAVRLLETRKVDALISDIRMPVMDGVTLVRTIAAMKLNVPCIIFVSGFGEVDVREAHSLGVEAMLPKPLSRRMLMQALEDCLKERLELWLSPLPEAPPASFTAVLNTLDEAFANRTFQLGRGGCAFMTGEAHPEETPLNLSIEFTGEGTTLAAQARVRWFDARDSRMGVEFVYLAPECRDWVIHEMQRRGITAFIPYC